MPVRQILGAHYFVYFGTLGIFLPYFNLYCRHLGFSGMEIGILSAVKTAGVVIFPVLWAMAADRLDARKSILFGCTLAGALVWAFLLQANSFGAILAILALYSVFYAPVISFIEAFAMEILGPDRERYGAFRVWGSIAFILVSVGLGKYLTGATMEMIIPLILAAGVLQCLLVLGLPGTRTDNIRTPDVTAVPGTAGFFLRPDILLFLLAAFLMLVSHGAYYGFFSIHLEALGMSTGFIGMAWALASVAEISVMLSSDRLFKRFEIRSILLFSFAVAVARWLLLYAAQTAVMIFFSQLLHALTYGAFHVASILAIERLSPPGGKTVGQAVNNAVTYGAGMMAGFFLSGLVYDTWHALVFPACSGVALAGAGVMWVLHRRNAFSE